MNRIWKAGLIVFVSVLLVMLPLISGCAPTEEVAPPGEPAAPQPTEKPSIPEGATIKVGAFHDLSGPYATQGVWARVYDEAYVNYINSEGGINGIPVELLWVDTALQIPKAVPALQRWADEGVCVTTNYCSQMSEGLLSFLDEVQIPMISSSVSYKGAFPPGWGYLLEPTYVDQCGAFLLWLKKNWQEDRPPKVGMLCFDTVTGRSIEAPELWDFAEQLGIDMHQPIEYFDVRATSVMPNLKRLEEAEVDWIWVMHFGAGTAIILNDAERLGLREQIGMCGPHFSTDDQVFDLAKGNAIGFKSVWPWGSWDEPETKKWIEWALKVKPEFCRTGSVPIWQVTMLACDAAEIAIENEDWPVNGASVNKALQGMKSHDMRGTAGKMTFGPDRRIGSYDLRIIELQGDWQKYEDRQWTVIEDWFDGPQIVGKEYFTK